LGIWQLREFTDFGVGRYFLIYKIFQLFFRLLKEKIQP